MDKMLVIIFEKESQAFDGSRALVELQLEGSLHLYAQAIIARGTDGKVTVKLPSDSGPIGAAVSVFTQSLVGRFGEPVGPAVEAGAFGRVLFDLARLEAGEEFLAEVEHSFEPGKSALIAEVWETGTLAVDKRMQALNGAIHRSTSSEAWDSLIQKNAAALKADLGELQADHKHRSDLLKKARELIIEALSI